MTTAAKGIPTQGAKSTVEPIKLKVPAKPRKQLTHEEQVKRHNARVAKFQEIGARRVRAALTVLRRLETVGRSPSYTYSAEQAAALVKYLEDGVERVKLAFAGRVARKEFEVQL